MKDPNSRSIMESIFTWFISVTKEERKFHVLLSSSDSFVHNWLRNLVGTDRFQTFVVGHLSKEEAKEYWHTQVALNGFCGYTEISFDEVYNICGSSMFLLLELYHSYVSGGIHPSRYFYVYQARVNLVRATSPDNLFNQDPSNLLQSRQGMSLKRLFVDYRVQSVTTCIMMTLLIKIMLKDDCCQNLKTSSNISGMYLNSFASSTFITSHW